MPDISLTFVVIWIILVPLNVLVVRWVNKPDGTWTRSMAVTSTLCSILIAPLMTGIFLFMLAMVGISYVNDWTLSSKMWDRWTDWWAKEMW